MPDSVQDKIGLLKKLLQQGTTQIVLDPRCRDVRVPPSFSDSPMLRLNLSFRFPNADLQVDWRGVCQTLTFPEGTFACRIPWAAIFAMGDPRRSDLMTLWEDSVPLELRRRLPSRRHQEGDSQPDSDLRVSTATSSRRQGAVRGFTPRVIPGDKGQDDAPEGQDADEEPEPDGPSPDGGHRKTHLRVVK